MKQYIFLLAFTILSCDNNSSKPSDDFVLEKEFIVRFEEIDESLSFHAKVWGIAGNHYQITLQNLADSSKAKVIFFTTELFYEKKHPDTLVIYSGALKGELNKLSSKIKFQHVESYNFHDFFNHHEAYGLNLISAYEKYE